MAQDGDDKGLDEHTRIGVAPTPKLPGAPATPSPPAPAQAPDEHTRLQGAPPPNVPRPPAPPAAAAPGPPPAPSPDESTHLGAKPPAMPKAPAPPPASAPAAPSTVPKPAAPPPAAGGGDFTEHTVLLSDLQPQALPAARLQRMKPAGRSDIVTLDRTHYLLGRLPSCDLRLYSQTASREHAQLSAREGRWYLTPVTGKVVLVNGTQVKEEVPLTHKMRLQLGGDELLFLDESGAAGVVDAAPSAGTGFAGNRWLVIAVGLVVLAAALWLWAAR
jgi:hypothetical protein